MWARNPFGRRLRLSVDPGNVARNLRFVQFDHVAIQVPDVAAALDWWRATVPGAVVLYADETWGLIEAAGARIALVVAEQHPDHLAFKVSGAELDRLAAEHARPITTHRDDSRSFYLHAPGGHGVEVIAYPDALPEDAE
jgi:catechol 2,3-dioxygenase-like lactoylglutathione lyase family enzyme